MTDRLSAARAQLAAGRRDAAIAELEAAVAEGPQGVAVWRMLTVQLYNAGRFEAVEQRAAEGLAQHPGDYEISNTRGVALRRLKRLPEAAAVLEAATAIQPRTTAAWLNLGNVLMDMGEARRAEAVYAELARLEPQAPAHPWRRGRTLWRQQRFAAAADALREALALDADHVDAWSDLAAVLLADQKPAEALAALEDAIRRRPAERRLLEEKAVLLRRTGRAVQAAGFLEAVETIDPNAAWIRYQRGLLYGDRNRAAANAELEAAHAGAPGNVDYAMALCEGLARDRSETEGQSLDRAYRLALDLAAQKPEPGNKILSEVLGRACDFEAVERLGSFAEMGRSFARSGRHAGLLDQLPRVVDDADRLELLAQHRLWGRNTEAWAARAPISRRAPRPPDGRLRLGFLSSDLRRHAVGYFALPLFEHRDPRFDLHVYSFYPGREDDVQARVRAGAAAFRSLPHLSARDAAQAIADDQLDLLIELGGSTQHNRIEVMAFQPAPRLASWLGYPHSVGLSNIDWMICDPLNAPQRAELMIERPLPLPTSWITLGEHAFTDETPVTEAPPSARNGFVTFGTANNPYKYNRRTLQAWARVVAAVPGSRFMVVRPEAASAAFRANIERAFAAEGVEAGRLLWRAVRGEHLAHLNDVDVCLDTFPLTGGTTTTESLWMGVPVVSLAGPAFYERLSRSILTNAGLGDLCADDIEGYQATAMAIAADEPRRRELRRTLRAGLRNGPLGRTAEWARDFYETVWTAVRGSPEGRG